MAAVEGPAVADVKSDASASRSKRAAAHTAVRCVDRYIGWGFTEIPAALARPGEVGVLLAGSSRRYVLNKPAFVERELAEDAVLVAGDGSVRSSRLRRSEHMRMTAVVGRASSCAGSAWTSTTALLRRLHRAADFASQRQGYMLRAVAAILTRRCTSTMRIGYRLVLGIVLMPSSPGVENRYRRKPDWRRRCQRGRRRGFSSAWRMGSRAPFSQRSGKF